MINPDAEINRLRSFLGQRGWMQSEIDEICDLVANDINEVILDIVSNAIAETTDYALDIGAEEFIEDIDIIDTGSGYMISTISGKTDYSVPEMKMLPDLVKNGEVSADGDRYRVIPIGGRSSDNRDDNAQEGISTVGRNKFENRQARDIFTMLQQKDATLQQARRNINQNALNNRSQRAQALASHWRDVIKSRTQQHTSSVQSKRAGQDANPEFRTASEKQDPQTQWVIPAKEMDMTGYIMDMNKRIQDGIYESVMFIISSYEKEFA
jgi:hypothetical protein